MAQDDLDFLSFKMGKKKVEACAVSETTRRGDAVVQGQCATTANEVYMLSVTQTTFATKYLFLVNNM